MTFASSGALLVTVSPPIDVAFQQSHLRPPAASAEAALRPMSVLDGETISADRLAPAVRLPVENPSPPGAGPAPTAPPVGSTGPSGQAMPVGDLPGWRQIFTDDFTTDVALGSFPAAVKSKWSAYGDGWKDTSKYGSYFPSKVVSITGGVLTKYIHTDNGVPLVAALTPKLTGTTPYGLTYGRFAVRFRNDSIAGYKMAWLLWPDTGNNAVDGEIDWPEMNLDGTAIWGFMHRTNRTSSDDQAWFKAPAVLSDWHTVVIEWSPDLVVYLLDGVEIGRTTERVPKSAMHWVLQTETALKMTAPPAPTANGNVQIDWVAAWAYDTSIT